VTNQLSLRGGEKMSRTILVVEDDAESTIDLLFLALARSLRPSSTRWLGGCGAIGSTQN
jgi:hypothetical protein